MEETVVVGNPAVVDAGVRIAIEPGADPTTLAIVLDVVVQAQAGGHP